MGETKIQWTNKTWNPITGCTKVSPGCDNCYAEAITKRFKLGPFEEVTMHLNRMAQPFAWKKPQMIFVCSMSDLFHPAVPFSYIHEIFDVMAANSHHTFQVLTKRPGRMAHFAEKIWELPWPDNVWAGTSVESQKYAPRLDVLARVPARVRFVSVEPMLGPVDLKPWLPLEPPLPQMTDNRTPEELAQDQRDDDGWRPLGFGAAMTRQQQCIQWVIAGGESGPKARPMDREWVRKLRDDCLDAQVPFFFKQWGAWCPFHIELDSGWEKATEDNRWMYERAIGPGKNYLGRPRHSSIQIMYGDSPVGTAMFKARMGAKDTGSILDGEMWREFPGDRLVNRETWKPVNA